MRSHPSLNRLKCAPKRDDQLQRRSPIATGFGWRLLPGLRGHTI